MKTAHCPSCGAPVAFKSTASVYAVCEFCRSTLLRDPFIKYLTYDVSGTLFTWVNLVDTHSVEAGATYHYYLVNYGPNGEIRQVWDCGQITIPED